MRIDAPTLLAGAAIIAASAWGLGQILAPPPDARSPQRPALEAGPVPDGAALQAVAARLRRPEPASAPEPAASPRPTPAVEVRLIGLVESDTGWVALISHAGETTTVRPGGSVGGYSLTEVGARSVVLEREGERLRLELES
ncbi:hypothetical protein DDZ18_03790 [Marinicauda salina]|uniref:Type II secretion system protein GspC N-terminal domain-containing protein n=1 Tax=Marinicauda salina TaxID=2135793 RepID=A0A2U2BXM7_9PROT|nr:type II secretion system protein N [Marinicauda salina]PWE18724.1 hypothetical protein DDZ18_03790 [Marinicauda salina]